MGDAEFIGTCVGNPFGDVEILVDIVENKSHQISKRTFLKHCCIADDLKADFREYPRNFTFYKSTMPFTRQPVYFYNWSAIEFFYIRR